MKSVSENVIACAANTHTHTHTVSTGCMCRHFTQKNESKQIISSGSKRAHGQPMKMMTDEDGDKLASTGKKESKLNNWSSTHTHTRG